MMITMFCHNTECHTDNQWIVTNSWCQASYLFFKSGNISLYYLCMCTLCRPHQLEQMRAIGLWEIWPESNENHQYLILISLRLDGNPFLGLKLKSIKFQFFWNASSNNLSNELIFIDSLKITFYVHTWSFAKLMQIWFAKSCQSKSWIGADCRKIGGGQELTWRPTTLTLISRFRKHFLKWTIF